MASRLGLAPTGAVSLVALALVAAACGSTDDEVTFGSSGGGGAAGLAGNGAGGRAGGAQGGNQATAGSGGTSSKGGSGGTGGTASKGGSGGTGGSASKGGSGGSTSKGGAAGADGGSAGEAGAAGQSDGGNGGASGGKAGSGSGGKGGAAGKAGSAGEGGSAGTGTGGKGGANPAGAGGTDDGGSGGSDNGGSGGTDTGGSGGTDNGGSGGTNTAGSGGTNNGGSAGAPPTCGDGIRNQLNEQCDGKDFGGNTPTCANGSTGVITCNENCTRNFSACVQPTLCGNGNIDAGEECDAKNPRCQACKIVCGNEEKRFENRCYRATGPQSFNDAEATCVQRGGHLVTIGSAAENKFVYDLAGGNSSQPLASKIWIGLNDQKTEGTFAWVSGSTGSYRNFRDGEPNAYTSTEDCAAMYLQLGTWNDDECIKQFVGVCEFNPQAQ